VSNHVSSDPDAKTLSVIPEGQPGAPPFDDALRRKLAEAMAAKGPSYRARTRHLRPDGTPQFANRLLLETSPYLLQHAHNPVNWFAWGPDAFETARKLGRPVFLSVGYSTCHWCHVMEEESFEDVEIATYLNGNYIPIKVDREERPDIDAIYMNAVQMLTGGGGWPMSVWLTPDGRPYFGGTYFPARDGDRGAARGFLTVLHQLREAYAADAGSVERVTSQLTEAIRDNLHPKPGPGTPSVDVLHQAERFYESRFDSVFGGTAGAPKFPSSLPIRFLLRYYRHTNKAMALDMATATLEKMAAGGIYDHVGGGFHRYSTDLRWLVPHFEKMLYDNALLTLAYLEGYQVTGREDFARVAREILRYVERDMTSPDGAFYSATDADSLDPQGHREEGWFFTWTPAEIEAVLGPDRAKLALFYYGVTPGGNFEGRNILSVNRPLADVARDLRLPSEGAQATLAESRELLYQARLKRPPPLRDEKILSAWNGLMISAHARAAMVLGDPAYARTAARAADFVLDRLRQDGRLMRSHKDGQTRHAGYLDDYAFLIAGLLDLFEATSEPRWMREAVALDEVLANHFEDRDHGGFFMTADDGEKLLAREKPNYDGAEPSGNSVQVLNLLRLNELTANDGYRQRAAKAFTAFSDVLTHSSPALSEMLLALDFQYDTAKQVVIVTPKSRDEAEPFLAEARKVFSPNAVLAVVSQDGSLADLRQLVPITADKVASHGKATAYLCEHNVCQLPTTDPMAFAKQYRKVDLLSGS
jgi:uncharacterized protein